MRGNRAGYLLRAATIFAALAPITSGSQRRGGLPVSFLMVFLFVALNEGLGVNEYARRFGVNRWDMSHLLRSIGIGGQYTKRNYGLVTFRKSPTNKSGKMVFLTKKGKKLFDKLNYA